MKNLLGLLVTASALGTGLTALADDTGSRIRFVQPKTFIEQDTSPLSLYAVFDRQCNWSVYKVIREDETLADGRLVVNVGLLVSELDIPCVGMYSEDVYVGDFSSSPEVRAIVK